MIENSDESPRTGENPKAGEKMHAEQYKVIADARVAQNNLLWQTPPLAAAILAVFLAMVFNKDTPPAIAVILSIFSILVTFAAIQLMAKHRHVEKEHAEMLFNFENANVNRYEILHGGRAKVLKTNWFINWSSYQLWTWVLVLLCVLAAFGGAFNFWKSVQQSEIHRQDGARTVPQEAEIVQPDVAERR